MAVNTLVTGLIVFKILKVFLEVKPTSVERSLGSLGSGGTKLRHIIFIIIESGMVLFTIQLVRFVLSTMLPAETEIQLDVGPATAFQLAFEIVVGMHEMFNVNINPYISTSFVLLMTFMWLGHRTNNNFGADLNEVVFR